MQSGAQTSGQQYAILIEGTKDANLEDIKARDQLLSGPHPEVVCCYQIAKNNHLPYFDPIISFDVTHITFAFSKLPAHQHQRLVHAILDFFRPKFQNDQIVFNLLIAPAYHCYFTQSKCTTLPGWHKHMSQGQFSYDKKQMINAVYDKHNNREQMFTKESEIIIEWLLKKSNELSKIEFLRYLEANPNITHVVGLVGLCHLRMLDSFQVKIRTPFNVLIDVPLQNNRVVSVCLMGSQHGEFTGFRMLSSYLEKNHFDCALPEEMLRRIRYNSSQFLQSAGVTLCPQFQEQKTQSNSADSDVNVEISVSNTSNDEEKSHCFSTKY